MPTDVNKVLKIKCKKVFLWLTVMGCSNENSFPVVFSLNREIDIISSRSYTKHFPAWARFIFASC